MDDTVQQPNHYLCVCVHLDMHTCTDTYTCAYVYTHRKEFSVEKAKAKYKLIWVVFKYRRGMDASGMEESRTVPQPVAAEGRLTT